MVKLYKFSVELLPLIHLLSGSQFNSLNCRLLENWHYLVIVVIIVYQPRFQKKEARGAAGAR